MRRSLALIFVFSLAAVSQALSAPSPDEVRAQFARGKLLYHAGKFEEALAVWKPIAPYAGDEVEVLGLIAAVEEKIETAKAAQSAADSADASAAEKPALPAELTALLKSANARFQSQIAAARGIESDAMSRQAANRAFIDRKLEEGKALMSGRRYREAAAAWRELIPYFSDGETLKPELQALESGFEESVESKKSAEDALARRDVKPPVPADARKFVSDQIKDLETQTLDAEKKEGEAVAAIARRRDAARDALVQAREDYEAGDVDKAIEGWKAVAPEFSDGRTLLRDLDALKLAHAKSLAAWDAMKRADEAARQKLDPSEELKLVISQAKQKYEKEAQEARVQTVTIKKQAGTRPAAEEVQVPIDDVDKMMLDFNVTTMDELKRRYEKKKLMEVR